MDQGPLATPRPYHQGLTGWHSRNRIMMKPDWKIQWRSCGLRCSVPLSNWWFGRRGFRRARRRRFNAFNAKEIVVQFPSKLVHKNLSPKRLKEHADSRKMKLMINGRWITNQQLSQRVHPTSPTLIQTNRSNINK